MLCSTPLTSDVDSANSPIPGCTITLFLVIVWINVVLFSLRSCTVQGKCTDNGTQRYPGFRVADHLFYFSVVCTMIHGLYFFQFQRIDNTNTARNAHFLVFASWYTTWRTIGCSGSYLESSSYCFHSISLFITYLICIFIK